MKTVIALFVIAFLINTFLGMQTVSYAQTSPVETPTVEVSINPVPDEPVPIPPTLLELIVKLINEGAGWLTGMVLLGLGIAQKWLVSFVRGLFPNDKKTATKINGGIAELVAGATSIATALIVFGVVWATGFVSSLDVISLLELAGITFVSGFTVHKVYKAGPIARVSK